MPRAWCARPVPPRPASARCPARHGIPRGTGIVHGTVVTHGTGIAHNTVSRPARYRAQLHNSQLLDHSTNPITNLFVNNIAKSRVQEAMLATFG